MERAIKHLKNTFSKERIYRKKEDLDALNEIIIEYNKMEQQILKRNNLFIKMFINEFLMQTVAKERSSQHALDEIHRLLEIPLEEYYHQMRKEIPFLRFKAVSDKIGVIPILEQKEDYIKVNNDDDTKKHNQDLITKHQKQLERALTTEYSEKELKGFLDQHLKNTILKYASYD